MCAQQCAPRGQAWNPRSATARREAEWQIRPLAPQNPRAPSRTPCGFRRMIFPAFAGFCFTKKEIILPSSSGGFVIQKRDIGSKKFRLMADALRKNLKRRGRYFFLKFFRERFTCFFWKIRPHKCKKYNREHKKYVVRDVKYDVIISEEIK